MIAKVDTGCMVTFVFLIAILALCLLAPFFGADSRHDEPARHHRNLP
jgi:hypothetical protein